MVGRKEITRQEIKRMIRQKGGGGGGNVSSSSNVSGDSVVGGNLTLSTYEGVLRADANGLVLDDTTTSHLPEGSNLYFTVERAQDAVGIILTANFDYDDNTPEIDLSDTGVTANTYGDATNVPQFTVDAKGRITGVTNVTISAGNDVAIEEGGVSVVAAVTTIDFNSGFSVADAGGGEVTVTLDVPSAFTAVQDTGTGSSQNVTLPVADLDEQDVAVFVNGIRFEISEYSISGTDLTLTTNASGDTIEVIDIRRGVGGGGGGGSGVDIEEEGSAVATATVLNFIGASVTAADAGGGEVTITIDPPVDTVFGRTGTVVAAASDYDADQVDYDNSTSGLTATDVQAAIDEVATTEMWRLVNTVTGSGVASLDVPLSTGVAYLIKGSLVPATDGVALYARTSDSGAYNAGAADYSWNHQRIFQGGTGWNNTTDSSDSEIEMSIAAIGNAAGEGVDIEVEIWNPSNAARRPAIKHSTMLHTTAADIVRYEGIGQRLNAEACDGVRFLMSSGNLSGTLYVYALGTS